MPARHYGSDYERRSSHPIRQSARRRDQLDAGHRPARPFARRHRHSYQAPLDAHAIWKVKEGRREAISLLEEQSAIRVPDLIPLRYKRMSASPFTFYRGTVLIMTNDLASTPVTGIPVQCVGDAHIGNFGIFRSPSARLVFDINDFDETAIGPWEWDLKRLAASVEICGRANKSRRRTVAPPWSSAYTRTAHA